MTNYPEMDLLAAEAMSAAEISALHGRLLARGVTGYPLGVFALWTELDPSVVKRYMLQVDAQMPTPECARLCNLATLHHYAVLRFGPGIAWELDTAARAGFTRAAVLEILALAYLNGGPATQHAVQEHCGGRLRDWRDPPADERAAFPAGWAAEPDAFRSGLEVSSPPTLSAAERAALEAWYRRTIGEVPAAVEFLAAHRPDLLKAYRLRWENCIRTLPKQVMPFVLLHHNAMRGDAAGLREAALLGRAWGMTREQATWGLTVGISFGAGLGPMGTVQEAVADLLADWE